MLGLFGTESTSCYLRPWLHTMPLLLALGWWLQIQCKTFELHQASVENGVELPLRSTCGSNYPGAPKWMGFLALALGLVVAELGLGGFRNTNAHPALTLQPRIGVKYLVRDSSTPQKTPDFPFTS